MPAPDLRQIQLASSFFVECAILNDESDPVLQLGTLKFRLSHQIKPAFSAEDNDVLIDLAVQCQALDEQTGQPLPVSGRFRLRLEFRVANLEEYYEPQLNGSQAPSQELILTLISVAYSTARGLIAAKTTGTVLTGFVLPLLDVRDLLRPASEESHPPA